MEVFYFEMLTANNRIFIWWILQMQLTDPSIMSLLVALLIGKFVKRYPSFTLLSARWYYALDGRRFLVVLAHFTNLKYITIN